MNPTLAPKTRAKTEMVVEDNATWVMGINDRPRVGD
jgi:hypothetical protein